MIGDIQCVGCKHLINGKAAICRGVPNGIPPQILDNRHKHRKPYRGERGIRREHEGVRERGVTNPEDFPPGRQLIVGWLGDLQHGVAKWQFGLHEDGRCGAMVWVPFPGLKWRHSRPKPVETPLAPERAAMLGKPRKCAASSGT